MGAKLPAQGREGIQHLDPDTLKLMARDRLCEPRLSVAERHLLTCDACRRAMTEMDQYVAAMRAVDC